MVWKFGSRKAVSPSSLPTSEDEMEFGAEGFSDSFTEVEVATQRAPGASHRADNLAGDHASDSNLPISADDQVLSEAETQQQKLADEVHREVIGSMDLSSMSNMEEEDLKLRIRAASEMYLRKTHPETTRDVQIAVIDDVINETFGLGPLEPIFRDPSVSDIMINGAKTVYVERAGRLELTGVKFNDDEHVIKIIQRIVGALGRRVDETSPMVDGRLPDGSRINAIIPPLAIDGPLVSIRRFGERPLHIDDIIAKDSITPEMVEFLRAVVGGRLNVVVSGGTGSGKTTLLNILSSFIHKSERVATIEDAAELQLQQPHVIRMETRPANIEGEGEVTTRDLVRNSLRMRPDRVIIGECRGPEALDMLQAMNTGHDGSLTTIHANTPRDAMMRLEMMVGMTGIEIPTWTIRRQIASAVHIVVQAARLSGGVRKITKISEVTGMEGEILTMHDIFEFVQTGVDENRTAIGYFQATGVRPHCFERLKAAAQPLHPEMFEHRRLTSPEGIYK